MAKKTREVSLEDELRTAAAYQAGTWFEEGLEIPRGRSMRIRVEKMLTSFHSKYQKIDVFETQSFGKMLCLDGTIQLTEFDEPNYHEMMAHVPLCTLPNPRRVLVIGGGDGGIVTQVLKHRSVREIHLCELDPGVVEVSKKYLPKVSAGLTNKNVKIFYQDGAVFVRQRQDYYDAILVDSTDPVGPGKVLFQLPFYRDMRRALRPDGICVTQSESLMYHGSVIRSLARFQKTLFPTVQYYFTLVPTYPSGVIGFSFCSKRYDGVKHLRLARAQRLPGLHYYSPEIHRAAFTLPRFASEWHGKILRRKR